MHKLSERGVIHLLIPLILLAGIIGGVYLITSGNPLKLFTRATNPPIVFKATDGSTLPTNSSGIPQATALGFKIILTSPLGPRPGVSGGSVSDPVSGPVSTGTVQFKVAESPAALSDSRPFSDYVMHPQELGYTLSDQSPGVKFIWVEFKDNTGKTDRRSAQIEIITAPSGGTGAGYQRVFITKDAYSSNLGGLTGADAKCQDRAKAANLGGTWKAWLSDSTTSASSRLIHHTTPYKLVNGTVIANNWDDLTDGTLQNTISITELGTTKNGGVWTNTESNGQTYRSDYCSDFTSSVPGQNFLLGWSAFTNGNWTLTRSGTIETTCNNIESIYCFEQTSTPSPTSTSTPTSTSAPTPSSGKTPPCEIYGDLNLDGFVNTKDVALASKVASGEIIPSVSVAGGDTQHMNKVGDVNNDNKVDTTDVNLISRYVDGLDSTFPVCQQAKLPPANCNNTGDVTTDGKVGPLDAYEASRINVGFPNSLYTNKPFTDDQKKRADVDGNGSVTSTDALRILRYIKGMDKTFKVCSSSTSSPTPYSYPTPYQTPSYGTPSYSTPYSTPSVPTPSTNTCTSCGADINKSGGVDIGDFSFLVSCYNKKATDRNIQGKPCAPADINGDGVVNGQDFSCLRSQYGKRCQ